MSEEEYKTEFQYPLKHPFNYAQEGNSEPAKFVLLKAPTSKTTRECAALKQAFFRAMGESDTQNVNIDEEERKKLKIEGPDVIVLLASANNVVLPDVMDVGRKLLQFPGIALVDGETKFGNALFDRMSIDDFEDMLGEYMVNFTLASSLKRLKEKSVKGSQI